MKRTQACSALRAFTAGLVMLVVALAPLHSHAGATEPTGTCLLCEVSHRVLDLPVDGRVPAVQPAPVCDSAEGSRPRALLRDDARDGRPSNPRAPPLHS